MAINISPLKLLLDDENPRFVILNHREQADIRKYLVTYEDVCSLIDSINEYGGILPGERIVALKKGDKYVVIEGNRRTCSLQLLLNPDLIPDGFQHRIPIASDTLKMNCKTIEIDLVPSREAALELMTKRHIEGVKQWKPLAKMQFFAANFDSGMSIPDLARITGVNQTAIKRHIEDYKFFHSTYTKYCQSHPNYHQDIIDLKTDPFLRIFKSKFFYNGQIVKPVDILKISYTENLDIVSELPSEIFESIVQVIFIETVIDERINTRNTLNDISSVMDVLSTLKTEETFINPSPSDTSSNYTNFSDALSSSLSSNVATPGDNLSDSNISGGFTYDNTSSDLAISGGPAPGGPPPRTFFETLSWRFLPKIPEYDGLIASLYELYLFSVRTCGRKKAYEIFPVATGMILRTAYEQILILRLRKTDLWSSFMMTIKRDRYPILKEIESFCNKPENIKIVMPNQELQSALNSIIKYGHREFLNANIHSPGNIRVSPESLSAIAQAGMFTLIQNSINLL